PLFLTANHCISTTAEASSIQTDWFFQAIACGSSTANPQRVSVAGGAQLLYTNQMADSTLIRLNMMPPAGTVYSGWDANPLEDGDAVQSLSHPDGDVMKYAIGNLSVPDSGTGTVRIYGYPQDMYGVLFSRGIIEGGSSGSGLFTRSGTSLVLHGILSGSTLRSGSDLACDNLEENATYGRFDIFYTQIRPFLDNTPYPTDDHPNQPTPTATTIPLNGSVSGRIERAGDLDVFKIVITQAGTLAVGSRGGNDMIGTFLKADGSSVTGVASDDVELSSVNNEFGFTTEVTPGTYYVSVGTFDPNATTPGGYQVFTKFTTATENYTALWWNPNESGWGLNINHQSNAQGIIFATLFNYDLNGEAAWWVMSNGALQPDGSFFGELYRTTGPAFNSVPFTPIGAANITQVGTMRLTFQGPQNATLTYTINGITVTKQIVRQIFATLPTCKFSGFERSNSPDFLDFNFTDLYWNPSESGWGINLTHQSDIIFATLFNYGADGKGIWLVMSNGARTSDSEYIYQDDLYQTTGPAFNAEPFTPIGAANITKVGTMRIEFTERGDQALLTYSVNGVTVSKNIQRQVFADLRTACGNEF
ncbi:MAG: hypothetical protein JNM52_03295, partial [Betaproteobacteria bacterium]|nr:hypothetical protein [Betaproteobacteria bacterium]